MFSGFFKKDSVITGIFNPLHIMEQSVVEFKVGELAGQGIFRFKKIVQMTVGTKKYSRYILFSNLSDQEYIMEVFPLENMGGEEVYLYHIADTVPFTEDFLINVAGQRYIQMPGGMEFERALMPETDERLDGLKGTVTVYNIGRHEVERTFEIEIWDYQREREDGIREYLNLEMEKEDGMFRLFIGEKIEDIFYKVYHNSKK